MSQHEQRQANRKDRSDTFNAACGKSYPVPVPLADHPHDFAQADDLHAQDAGRLE